MIEVGDSVFADADATEEYVVVSIDGDQVTAVEVSAQIRTRDKADWYDSDGQLRWSYS
jgi:hypothetical protein